jgi:DNA-3-methyladenine glycosylase II
VDRAGRHAHRAPAGGRRAGGDLALRKAIQAAYQLDHRPSQQEVLAIAEKWRPYRSLATSYLFSAAFEPAGREPAAAPADSEPAGIE